jgi:microcystin degradation protein MlrC
LTRLDAARPFDAVLLSLHGAMVVEGEDDADGATLEAIRRLLGPDVPLVVSMDLHANLTRRCIENADAIVGFRTSPHIDQGETGRRAARLLCDWLEGKTRPVMEFVKVPMVTPASTHIHFLDGPFKRLMDAGQALEANGEALAASVLRSSPGWILPRWAMRRWW